MMQRQIDPRERTSTAEFAAYHYVLTGIRTGRFVPGSRLIADDIAAAINMSRMPVREAFRRLATEGLLVLRPNVGCIVSGLSVDEIFEVFEIRAVLEGLAVRLAMPQMDAAALSHLEGLLALMKASDLAGRDDWIAEHTEFHRYLCGLCGRRKLMRQIQTLHVSIEPYLRIYYHHVDKPRTADEAHRVLFDAIRSGDPTSAEQAVRAHVSGTAPMLAAFINRTGEGAWSALAQSSSSKPTIVKQG
jgi:DNA-binding GntR family transcriptional regulator